MAIVVGAGAVATSIGAILALWPNPPLPPAVLDAEFSDVTVDENIPIGQYTARETDLQGSAAGSGAGAQLAALTVPQDSPAVTGAATVQQTDTTTTTGTTGTTQTTDTTQTTETTGTTTEDDPGGQGLSDEARGRLNEALGEALSDPGVVAIDVGPSCEKALDDEDCAMKTLALKLAGESPSEAAEQLAAYFTEVRKRQVSPGASQPLGVTVNYKLTVTGFRRRTVRVRWELHRGGGGQLPFEWLRKQRPISLVGEADRDSVSPNLWVPMPIGKGPFFIRLIVENEDGVPLDRANTPRFQ